jgi:hypothetical protein
MRASLEYSLYDIKPFKVLSLEYEKVDQKDSSSSIPIPSVGKGEVFVGLPAPQAGFPPSPRQGASPPALPWPHSSLDFTPGTNAACVLLWMVWYDDEVYYPNWKMKL